MGQLFGDNQEPFVREVQSVSPPVCYATDPIDLTVVADYDFDLPSRKKFFATEFSIFIVDSLNPIVGPRIRYGDRDSKGKLIVPGRLTGMFDVDDAFHFRIDVAGASRSLSAGIVTAGRADRLFGRFVFQGYLVDEGLIDGVRKR